MTELAPTLPMGGIKTLDMAPELIVKPSLFMGLPLSPHLICAD